LRRSCRPAFPQAALITPGLRCAHISAAFIALCTRRGTRGGRRSGRARCYRPTLAQIALVALAMIVAQCALGRTWARQSSAWSVVPVARATFASLLL
jgi:hypothetical protein